MPFFKRRPLPQVGLRMIRSSAAVLLCLLTALATGREELRIYASIAALQCIQPYSRDTWKMARQRLLGTAVGTAFGAAAILMEVYLLQIHGTAAGYALIALFIIPILWSTVALDLRAVSYFSCVVFLSITVTHITDTNPWLFVWNRFAETLAGVAIGVAVNAVHIPRRRRQDVLFVSGLDRVVLNARDEMTPYSRIQLNRMLDDGMLFTFSTMRTPASVREAAGGLHLRLPVIVMDGAALYDLGKKRFLHICILPQELVLACEAVFRQEGVHCFLNGVMDDVVMIYFGELKNDAERNIYESLRVSPYRCYVERRYYRQCPILYLMGIDKTERMERLRDALRAAGLLEKVKLRFYPSVDYPGYSYIKLYERSASQSSMLERLKAELGVEQTVMLSSESAGGEEDGNALVRRLERMYEPCFWERSAP